MSLPAHHPAGKLLLQEATSEEHFLLRGSGPFHGRRVGAYPGHDPGIPASRHAGQLSVRLPRRPQLPVDFHRLLSQFEINKEALLHRISERLSRKPRVSLREILDEHPLEDGLAELMTYFSIASQSPSHLINDEQYEFIPLSKDGTRAVRVPQIIFTR